MQPSFSFCENFSPWLVILLLGAYKSLPNFDVRGAPHSIRWSRIFLRVGEFLLDCGEGNGICYSMRTRMLKRGWMGEALLVVRSDPGSRTCTSLPLVQKCSSIAEKFVFDFFIRPNSTSGPKSVSSEMHNTFWRCWYSLSSTKVFIIRTLDFHGSRGSWICCRSPFIWCIATMRTLR